MGLFDGLIAKVEGAVHSAESVAAGLFHSKTPSPAPSSYTYDWQGPLQPGRVAPPSVVVTPKSPAKASPSLFSMGEDMVSKWTPFDFSFHPTTTLTAAPKDYAAEAGEWTKDLRGWDLTLSSADKFMNAKSGASDLSSAISTWRNGVYQDAQSKLSALVTGSGNYDATKRAHDLAVSQATDLQSKTQDRWAKFSADGVPSVADYAFTPFTAPVAAVQTGARAVYSGAEKAAAAVERAAAPLLDSSGAFLKYAPWIAGALGAAYVFSMLPKSRNN